MPDIPGLIRTIRYMGTFGPLARSVDDLDLALRVIVAPTARGRGCAGAAQADAPACRRGLRIAILTSNPLVPASAETASVVQATAKLLSKAGARVRHAEPAGLDWLQAWDDCAISSTT